MTKWGALLSPIKTRWRVALPNQAAGPPRCESTSSYTRYPLTFSEVGLASHVRVSVLVGLSCDAATDTQSRRMMNPSFISSFKVDSRRFAIPGGYFVRGQSADASGRKDYVCH